MELSNEEKEEQSKRDKELEELQEASSTTIRQFHEVLDELLSEFAYDVKTGQLNGLKNLAIRRVEVSESIPASYQKYLELLVEERIRINARSRIINCVPCHAKTSRLIDGKIIVTSPNTNIAELKSAAEKMGIENFMDVVLVYHSTHMVLGFQIFKSDTNETVWARSYNSETIKSRYQKLAIDFSQIKKSRPGDEYVPEFRMLLGLGGAVIPNVGGTQDDSKMFDVLVRSSERFNNRKSEFGLELNIFAAVSLLQTKYPTEKGTGESQTSSSTTETKSTSTAKPAPFKFALGIYGLYSHNFLGSVESYDQVRQGIHFGIGTLLAAGYLAPSVKIGWDMFFGRKFGVTLSGIYLTPSRVLLGEEFVETAGGAGGELVLSYNY